MKKLINNFAAARQNIFSARALMLLFSPLLLANLAHAQSKNDSPASKELYDQIASLDAALFAAYNTCDIDKVGTFFTEDLEFYHEKGGLTLPQLKIMQEVITLAVFVPFAVFYLKQPLKLDYLWAALCMAGAVYFIFRNP